MRRYTYRGFAALGVYLTQLGGVLALCFVTFVTVSVIALAMSVSPPYWDVFWFIAWWPLLGWPAGLSMMCMRPSSIWVDQKGLTVVVFWRKHISIPWSDVLEVRRLAFGASYFIKARRLTVCNRLVGLIFGHTLCPGFLISLGLENRDELVREIRLRIAQFD